MQSRIALRDSRLPFSVLVFALFAISAPAASQILQSVIINSVIVDGVADSRPFTADQELRLPPGVHQLEFRFSSETGSSSDGALKPRYRYRLEGLDEYWRDAGDVMRLSVLFLNSSKEILAQHHFVAKGMSAGWNGSPRDSHFTLRQEPVPVPPDAAGLRLILASGGPSETTGFMALANVRVLVLSEAKGVIEQMMPDTKLDRRSAMGLPTGQPDRWTRGGTYPDLAQVCQIDASDTIRGLCVVDNRVDGYGEWFCDLNLPPSALPGRLLLIEWGEAFDISSGEERVARYEYVPPGKYQFRVLALSERGVWMGASRAIPVTVLPYFWQTKAFWTAIVVAASALLVGAAWLLTRHRMQRQLERVERQRALEHELTRIARDIHDDIGASLTQIALLSELAQSDLNDPTLARSHLDQIFLTANRLTRQFDEIVWAINPAHDSLEEFAAFLSKFAQDYLASASLRCRLDLPETFPDRKLSPSQRHALFLCTKEALHNVVKHAQASEGCIRVKADEVQLQLIIEDNGKGFAQDFSAGDGLGNMRSRMEEIDGTFEQTLKNSGTETGAIIVLRLPWATTMGIRKN